MSKEALATHFKNEADALVKKLGDASNYTGETADADRKSDIEAMQKALADAEKYAAEVKADDGVEDMIEKSAARLAELAGMKSDDDAEGKSAEGKGIPTPDADGKATADEPEAKALSAGEMFVKSEAYVEISKKGFTETQVKSGAASVEVELKALIQNFATGVSTRYEGSLVKPLTLLDVIPIINVGVDALRVHRPVFNTNAAAITADGVASPESDISWLTVTLSPEDIVHHVPIDNNALNDHATVEGTINNGLAWGVRSKMQAEIMTDLGTTTGLLIQAFNTDIVTTLLDAKTLAETEADPSVIIMSPTDVNTLQKLKGTDDHYIGTGPFNFTQLVVWGLPVISTSACPVGTAYVGNAQSIVWRNRQDVEVTTGWINDQYIKRQTTIQAHGRGFLDVTLPNTMVKAALTV